MKTQPRTLPELNELNREFWTSGKDGALKIYQCEDCKYFIHPPKPICPKCYSWTVNAVPISGNGEIASFTINYQKWKPDLEVPYALLIVELEEQEGLRLTTNIVECEIDDIYIGMPVQIVFEHREDVYLPLFKPRKQ